MAKTPAEHPTKRPCLYFIRRHDDMAPLVLELLPDRWKVFQVCRTACTVAWPRMRAIARQQGCMRAGMHVSSYWCLV